MAATAFDPCERWQNQNWFPANVQSGLCHILVEHLQQGSLTITLTLMAVRMVGNHFVTDQAAQQILRRNVAIGLAFLMCYHVPLQQHPLHHFCSLIFFLNFRSMRRITS